MQTNETAKAVALMDSLLALNLQPSARYDSLSFAYALLYAATSAYQDSLYDKTVNYYEAAGGLFYVLTDSMQITVIRWAAESYRASGRLERARDTMKEALRRAVLSENDAWIIDVARCLDELETAVEKEAGEKDAFYKYLIVLCCGIITGVLGLACFMLVFYRPMLAQYGLVCLLNQSYHQYAEVLSRYP